MGVLRVPGVGLLVGSRWFPPAECCWSCRTCSRLPRYHVCWSAAPCALCIARRNARLRMVVRVESTLAVL